MKKTLTTLLALAGLLACADTKEAFLKQQAYAEMQRVSGQIDALQEDHDELASRVTRLEGGGGEIKTLKNDIDSLRAEIDQLRRDLQRQRKEIADELTKKVVELMKAQGARQAAAAAAAAASAAPAPAYSGPCQEYVVASGDTLSLIAQAFKTSVPKIKSMNNLKNDNLRIGQKLLVPKPGR